VRAHIQLPTRAPSRLSPSLALLCSNHEFTNRKIMFPPSRSAADEREVLKATMAAQGLSVVELERSGIRRPWHYVRGASRNRRMAARTPFTMTGPATGSHLLKTADDPSGRRVVGTFGNCSGGTTPWGIVLSGEENFDNYFVADPTAVGSRRYALKKRQSIYGWEAVDPRFDATAPDYAAEPHRFGYIIEIDPFDPRSMPRKVRLESVPRLRVRRGGGYLLRRLAGPSRTHFLSGQCRLRFGWQPADCHRRRPCFAIQGGRIVPGAAGGCRPRTCGAVPRRASPGRNLRSGHS